MQRQTDTIRDLYQRLDDLFSAESQNNFNERILETARNHGKLALRIDSILRQAMGRFQPGMSTQEKEWAESLDDLQKQVEGEQGYTARINKVSSTGVKMIGMGWIHFVGMYSFKNNWQH